MSFDIFYSTLFENRNYITTVDDEDTAADMCLANNKELSKLELNFGIGNMFFVEV